MPPFWPPETCEELAAYQAARPAAPAAYAPLGYVLYASFVFLAVVPNLIWYSLRDEPRLAKGRSLGVNIFTSCGELLAVTAVPLRYAVFDYSTNMTKMPCFVVSFSILTGVGVVATSACLRAYMMYARNFKASLLRDVKNAGQNDDSSSVTSSSAGSIKWRAHDISFFSSLAKGILLSFSKTSDKSETKLDDSPLMDLLLQTNQTLSGRGLALLALVFLIPVSILVVSVFGAVPAYRNCSGCDLDAPLVIACFVQAIIPFIFLLNMVRLTIKSSSDLYGIKTEMYLWIATVPMWYLIGLILVLADPNGMFTTYQFAWDWLLIGATYMHFCLWSIWPVWMAWRDYRARKAIIGSESSRKTTTPMAELFKGITDSLSDPVFEATCEKMYVSELLRFMHEVNFYKRTFYDKSEAWRKAKAAHIVERFIKDLAPMQVNISHELRRSVEEAQLAYETSGVGGLDIFDKARHEVMILLVDVYKKYMRDKAKGQHGVVALSDQSMSAAHEAAFVA